VVSVVQKEKENRRKKDHVSYRWEANEDLVAPKREKGGRPPVSRRLHRKRKGRKRPLILDGEKEERQIFLETRGRSKRKGGGIKTHRWA